jgi:hypothetical protein
MKSTNNDAFHYVIFSNLLLLRLLSPNIYLNTLFSNTIYVCFFLMGKRQIFAPTQNPI